MSRHTASRPDADVSALPVFASVLCAVEPGVPSFEAARQAAELAVDGDLALVEVQGDRRSVVGSSYLDASRWIARRSGAEPVVRRLQSSDASSSLVLFDGHYDLIVVPWPDRRRDAGDLVRMTFEHSPIPVLVARSPGHGRAVTDRLLVVTDGSRAGRIALSIARGLVRRHGSEIVVVTAGDDQCASDGVRCDARGQDSTLVVASGRCLAGTRDLASVVARLPCSVLVIPERPGRGGEHAAVPIGPLTVSSARRDARRRPTDVL
ncbi:MAG: hypothetical protein QOJ21_2937 [Solirubrobacteraceae bacterium]|nr:hypothetical protein [Solirubrobacteraceae bacterium]